LCLVSIFAFVFFSPSNLLAVSSGTCTVKDDSDDSGTLFTLRNRVEHGANLDQGQTCQHLIKFEAGEAFISISAIPSPS
jgi:hypothetical protein